MGSGVFRVAKIPAAVEKLMPRDAGQGRVFRTWDEISEQLGINPDISFEVLPVASGEAVSGRDTRPVAMVQEIGGERDAFFDDRLIRYIRIQFKGEATLHLQPLPNKTYALLGMHQGQVVSVMSELKSEGAVWADELRAAAKEAEGAPGKDKPARAKPVHGLSEPSMRPGTAPPATEPKPTTNPTPDQAAAAPPVPTRPVNLESASETEVLDAIEAMWDDEDAPTDVLYSDGAQGRQRMALAIQRMVELLMIDRDLTDFPQFAEALMGMWGNRRHRDRVFRAMRDWYEAGREAGVAPVMTPPQEIDRWYEENADVAQPDSGDAGRPERRPTPEGRPGTGGRRAGAGGVRAGDRGAGQAGVRGTGGQRPDTAGRGEGDRDGATEGGDRDRKPIPDSVEAADNWRFEPGQLDRTESRGPTAKARDNITAIETLKLLQREGRQATPSEQEILAQYVGWGGLQQVFPHPETGEYGKGFEEMGARLRELLTDEEYEQARASILNAHYTSETVISSIWGTLQRLGFTGGRIIEPGMGVGNFAGMMPPDLASESGYFGIELDTTSAEIAKHLYPKWTVRQQDFSRTAVPPDLFDAAVGNPPFANFSPADAKYDQHKFLLHDYFFAKTIDGIKPGGLMAFVSSAGTMNKRSAKARQYLADRADFLGAIRLPNTAFLRNAATEVTADIIFLRKRAAGQEPNHVAEWVESVNVEMPDREGGTGKGWVNPYFINNPDQVLGEPGLFDELVAGKRYSVRQKPGANLEADLAAATQRLLDAAPKAEAAARQHSGRGGDPRNHHEGGFVLPQRAGRAAAVPHGRRPRTDAPGQQRPAGQDEQEGPGPGTRAAAGARHLPRSTRRGPGR